MKQMSLMARWNTAFRFLECRWSKPSIDSNPSSHGQCELESVEQEKDGLLYVLLVPVTHLA